MLVPPPRLRGPDVPFPSNEHCPSEEFEGSTMAVGKEGYA